MRVAAGAALAAARSIAQISWRVDMALKSPSSSQVKFAELGKVRVNRIWDDRVLTEGGRSNQVPDRTALLSISRNRGRMDERQKALIRRAWPRQALFTLCLAVLLFAAAGTLAYWQGWLFLVAFIGSSVALGFYFVRHDPALIERRMKGGPSAEQEPAQKIIVALLMADMLLMILVPALDYRWHWSAVPAWLALLGNAGIVASFIIFFFVMKQNSYAAATVRVEAEQPVISTGLYGVVRHPMYSGALLLMVCMPLALGSSWSLLLLLPALPILAWRLIDEERVLTRDLPGYADYCRRVRYRLVPFVW
jgi:protein-S-isoprenylcysteine O-methyltransferase Ste14